VLAQFREFCQRSHKDVQDIDFPRELLCFDDPFTGAALMIDAMNYAMIDLFGFGWQRFPKMRLV
jgi:hypothetical protein